MLKQTEGVDVPLDRLLAVGKADLERNLAALDEACREFALAGTATAAWTR